MPLRRIIFRESKWERRYQRVSRKINCRGGRVPLALLLPWASDKVHSRGGVGTTYFTATKRGSRYKGFRRGFVISSLKREGRENLLKASCNTMHYYMDRSSNDQGGEAAEWSSSGKRGQNWAKSTTQSK